MKRIRYKKKYCECGCEQVVRPGRRFISGHNTKFTGYPSECLEAVRIANKGENNPAKRPEVKEKISKSNTGKKRTLEAIAKQIETQKHNVEWHKAMKTRKPPRLGTTTSPEALQNMKEANQKTHSGKPLSIEHKEKIRNGMETFYSNLENRITKAKEIANRVQKEGYKYKNGYVNLPRLNVSLFYRSSYEEYGLLLLDTRQEVSQILTEVIHIPYIDSKGKVRVYTPDWFVTLDDGQQILIEVKPKVFVNRKDVQLKRIAGEKWCKENNAIYCIWTEDILFDESSTTMSLRVIVEATATAQNGQRYSLNHTYTKKYGREQK